MGEIIERVTLTHLQIPLKEPFRTFRGERVQRGSILVTAVTTGGWSGAGECAPAPNSDGLQQCWQRLQGDFVPLLLGQAVDQSDEIPPFLDTLPETPANARCAVETVFLDLLGQIRHQSLAALLDVPGDRIDAGIEAGLVIGQQPTVVDLLRAIEPHLQEGYRRVKLKIRPGFDLEFVRAVRQHFGDDLPLMVDGQGAYSLKDLDLMKQLDQEDLLMIEQPFAAESLDEMAALQSDLVTPICLDETANLSHRGREAIERGCGRIVNLKLQDQGGLIPAQRLHDEVLARGRRASWARGWSSGSAARPACTWRLCPAARIRPTSRRRPLAGR